MIGEDAGNLPSLARAITVHSSQTQSGVVNDMTKNMISSPTGQQYIHAQIYVLKSQIRISCLQGLLNANNKGADQPAHPLSLISAFVIYSLESTTVEVAICQISLF